MTFIPGLIKKRLVSTYKHKLHLMRIIGLWISRTLMYNKNQMQTYIHKRLKKRHLYNIFKEFSHILMITRCIEQC